MVMGRPKIWTEEVIQKEADAILEWSKKDDSDYLGSFCDERDYDPAYIGEFCSKSEYFRLAIKRVKNRIAKRIRQKVQKGEYNYGLFMREINMYDSFLHAHEREEKKYDAQLKALTVDNVQKDLKDSFNSLMSALKETQDSASKNEINKNKNGSKS